nr:3,4-dihydroxy-2-butanone-4-phosphate synthase [Snodgrassella gandavensis]
MADLQHGKPIVITDDANRENETDLIIVVKMINTPIMAILIRHDNDIVCLCIENNLAKKLALSTMVEKTKVCTTPTLLPQSKPHIASSPVLPLRTE